ncbi:MULTISPECIES: C40 family peptidase [unclassified Thioalkalivibrio]|uniref:C40 family peptidase n=1 Tax=unclassified Thioalkalivibrio TaxID=2621013 RepID=UPI000360DE3C|nr:MULTISPECIES: C40 family peptidase [unclassified Thioalkalivibrio]
MPNAIFSNTVPRFLPLALVGSGLLFLAACSAGPEPRGTETATTIATPQPLPQGPMSPAPEAGLERSEVVLTALGHLDTPYRYGGTDASGLDCSALVQRAYREAGRSVPRTTRDQARAATRRDGAPAPGDVVFFAINGSQIDHVGVYVGDGRFVHAPSSRGQVRIEQLDNPYWAPRTRFAGHFFD